MSDFDTLLAKVTEKGQATVHGAICKCVDKNGNVVYKKISGYDSLLPDAAPLREDCVLKTGSSVKLITSIALLQCVDNGLIGLDEPIGKILPELENKNIVKAGSEKELDYVPSKNKITPRHLVSHMSGLGYRFLHPLLIKWGKTSEGQRYQDSRLITERYDYPLLFEPGNGWSYGTSLDWASLAISRLHGGMPLEEYMIKNIWKRLGLSAPFPTFNLSDHPEYNARLMQGAERTPDGSLKPYSNWLGDNLVDQEGGAGLKLTSNDFVAVLADLISDSPKLLKPEIISMMFEPQMIKGSSAMEMLVQLRPAWEHVAGPVSNDGVNHGLGGMLVTSEVPDIGQPKNVLAWGGSTNIVWFASKELGYAGFFATQLNPFADPAVKELVNAWKKDFWSTVKKA